jgi:hypothetical protein
MLTAFEGKDLPGLEAQLNWSLASLRIHPNYECFGNSTLKEILKRTYGKSDRRNDTLLVSPDSVQEFDILSLQDVTKYSWTNSATKFDPKQAQRVFRDLAYHLSMVPSSFVQDGDVGSSRESAAKLRVMTDSFRSLFAKYVYCNSKTIQSFEIYLQFHCFAYPWISVCTRHYCGRVLWSKTK